MTEAATILTVMALLTAGLSPSVEDFVARARMVRATTDARAIAVALIRLNYDTAGKLLRRGGCALLVSDGDIPERGLGGDYPWLAPPGSGGLLARWFGSGATRVAHLSDHLLRTSADPIDRVPDFGWRGPYLDSDHIGSDPWGARYAVNVAMLRVRGKDTFVLSAGPNGLVETPFAADSVVSGSDDILTIVSSGSGF